MKAGYFLIVIFSILNIGTMEAQCFKIISASHSVILGGREESKMDRFEIKLKKQDRFNFQYLMVGDAKVNLEQYQTGDILELRGFYNSGASNLPTFGTVANETTAQNIDLRKVYLYYNIKDSKILKKKRIKNLVEYSKPQ